MDAEKSFRSRFGAAFGEGFTFWDEFLPFLDGNKSGAADLTNMGRMPSHASMGSGSMLVVNQTESRAKSEPNQPLAETKKSRLS